MASGEDGTVIETAIVPFEWSLHTDDCCWVCKGKAGRQKKGTKKRGRPKEESGKGIANRVLRTAPPSWRAAQPLSLSRFLPPATSLSLHDLQCKLCGALAPDISSEHRTATTYSEVTEDGLAPHFHGFILTK